jgi:hypothetical protein
MRDSSLLSTLRRYGITGIVQFIKLEENPKKLEGLNGGNR